MDKFIDNLFSENLYDNKMTNKISRYNNSIYSLSEKYINTLNKIGQKRNAKLLTMHDFNKLLQSGGSDSVGFCDKYPTQCGVGGYSKTPSCGMTGGGKSIELNKFMEIFNSTSNYRASKNVLNSLFLLVNSK